MAPLLSYVRYCFSAVLQRQYASREARRREAEEEVAHPRERAPDPRSHCPALVRIAQCSICRCYPLCFVLENLKYFLLPLFLHVSPLVVVVGFSKILEDEGSFIYFSAQQSLLFHL